MPKKRPNRRKPTFTKSNPLIFAAAVLLAGHAGNSWATDPGYTGASATGGNTIGSAELTASTYSYIYGSSYTATGNATIAGNTITLPATVSVSANIYGDYLEFKASDLTVSNGGNTITIYGTTGTGYKDIYGSYMTSPYDNATSTTAKNTIIIKDGAVTGGDIKGSYNSIEDAENAVITNAGNDITIETGATAFYNAYEYYQYPSIYGTYNELSSSGNSETLTSISNGNNTISVGDSITTYGIYGNYNYLPLSKDAGTVTNGSNTIGIGANSSAETVYGNYNYIYNTDTSTAWDAGDIDNAGSRITLGESTTANGIYGNYTSIRNSDGDSATTIGSISNGSNTITLEKSAEIAGEMYYAPDSFTKVASYNDIYGNFTEIEYGVNFTTGAIKNGGNTIILADKASVGSGIYGNYTHLYYYDTTDALTVASISNGSNTITLGEGASTGSNVYGNYTSLSPGGSIATGTVTNYGSTITLGADTSVAGTVTGNRTEISADTGASASFGKISNYGSTISLAAGASAEHIFGNKLDIEAAECSDLTIGSSKITLAENATVTGYILGSESDIIVDGSGTLTIEGSTITNAGLVGTGNDGAIVGEIAKADNSVTASGTRIENTKTGTVNWVITGNYLVGNGEETVISTGNTIINAGTVGTGTAPENDYSALIDPGLYGSISLNQAGTVTATDNTVQNSGTVKGNVTGAYTFFVGNDVTNTGHTVTNTGTVYGNIYGSHTLNYASKAGIGSETVATITTGGNTIVNNGRVTGNIYGSLVEEIETEEDTLSANDNAVTIPPTIVSKGNTITIGSNGTVEGNVYLGTGDDEIIMYTSQDAITGVIDGQEGSDTIIISGGDWEKIDLESSEKIINIEDYAINATSALNLLGAWDIETSEIQVSGGILNVSGTLTADTLIVNSGTFNLTGTARVGSATIASSGTMTGSGTFYGNLINNGTITPGSAAKTAGRRTTSFSQLTISGDYAGSGTLVLDTDFISSSADYISVAGEVKASGTIQINDLTDGKSSSTTEIVLVEATTDADKSDESFVLADDGHRYNNDANLGQWAGSPYIWKLKTAGNNWVLGDAYLEESETTPAPTKPAVVSEIPAYISLPTFSYEVISTKMETLHQRMGELRNQSVGAVFDPAAQKELGIFQTPAVAFDDNRLNGWIKSTFSDFDFDATDNFELDGQYSIAEIGFDKKFAVSPSSVIYAGFFGSMATGDFDNSGSGDEYGSLFAADTDIDGWSMGIYGTWFHTSGLYVDMSLDYMQLDADIEAVNSYSTDGTVFSGSVEVGKSFAVNTKVLVEPQVELSAARVSWDDLNDGWNDVEFEDHTYVTGRLGIRAEYLHLAQNGTEIRPWVYAGIQNEFSDAATVNYVIDFESHEYDTTANLQVGITMNLTRALQLYGDAGYTSDLSDYSSYRADLGLRMNW